MRASPAQRPRPTCQVQGDTVKRGAAPARPAPRAAESHRGRLLAVVHLGTVAAADPIVTKLSDDEDRERGRRAEREVSMTEHDQPPRKLSRQQLRAQERERRDAEGWIAALDIQDLPLQRAIREAIGARRVTRVALEAAIGVSLVGTPRPIRGMRKS